MTGVQTCALPIYLEFGAGFPEAAIRCGADLVIESLHKTLPCYTQCAILHVGTGEINDRLTAVSADCRELTEQVEWYLRVYQTSSPSYLFVAGMEDCIATMEEWRDTRMMEYHDRLKRYRMSWSELQALHLLTAEEVQNAGGFAYDESKLVFCMPEGGQIGRAHV